MIKKTDQINKLEATEEVYTRTAYYLIDHLMRSDNPFVVEEAHQLANSFKLKAKEIKKTLENT